MRGDGDVSLLLVVLDGALALEDPLGRELEALAHLDVDHRPQRAFKHRVDEAVLTHEPLPEDGLVLANGDARLGAVEEDHLDDLLWVDTAEMLSDAVFGARAQNSVQATAYRGGTLLTDCVASPYRDFEDGNQETSRFSPW